MSRNVRLIVECEDGLHRAFATRFLRAMGIPAGREPEISLRYGKSGVLDSLVEQIRSVRSKKSEAHLIAVIDGDNWTRTKIVQEIDARLTAAKLQPLTAEDRVLLIVPRWQMDTWVRHLRGEEVTEAQNGAAKLDEDSEGRDAGTRLAEHCRNHRALKNPLPSLEAACQEWQAYRSRHGI